MTRSEQSRDERDAFVKGEARYVSDLVDRDDYLHGVFIRSAVAHGHLSRVDVSAARGSADVVAVLTHSDVADLTIPGRLRPNMADVVGMDRDVLAGSIVRYVGEPIAFVVATSEVAATDAADCAVIEYDELPVVVDAAEALTSEVVLFPGVGSNLVEHRDAGKARELKSGEVEVEVAISHPRVAAAPMEPLGCISVPGRPATFICGHQNPNGLRRDLARVLAVPLDDIRVQVPDVGGSFGAKGPFYPEYAVVMRASRLLNRPVAWRQNRLENIQTSGHGRAQDHVVKIRGTESGRITGLEVSILANLGAYPSTGSFVPRTTLQCAPGPYDVTDVYVEMASVVTNTAPIGQYRGAGRPEATLSLESALDAFAAKVSMDPVDLRRLNLIRVDHMPFTTATGAVYDGGDYVRALDQMANLLGIPEIRRLQEQESGRWRHGVGVAMFVEPAGGSAALGEYARVTLDPDGGATVLSGSIAAGQGHSRIIRDQVRTQLGIPAERVRLIVGDTGLVPRGAGTFGSRSAQTAIVAVDRALRRLANRCRTHAARVLGLRPIDTTAVPGGFGRDLGLYLSHAELAKQLDSGSLDVEEFYEPGAQTYPYGAYGAAVKIDLETGSTEVLRITAVDDCGRVLDPAGVHGQVIGAIAQGFGQSMTERVVYDGDGQPLTNTFLDYLIPTATQIPRLNLSLLSIPSAINDLGARGVGEAGTVGVPPAIVGAVYDAIGLTPGMPLTSERVWTSLRTFARAKP